jgi:hypothetical protein
MPRKPKLAGADFLILAAEEARESGHPYAFEFAAMVMAAFVGDELLSTTALAQRPLKDYEAVPVTIVRMAVEMARERGDRKSVDEAVIVGLGLLAKWPEFLDQASDEGHPYFRG